MVLSSFCVTYKLPLLSCNSARLFPLVVYPNLIPTCAAVVGTLKLTAPLVVLIAVCAPAVVLTLVIVPVFEVLEFQVYFSPVVTRDTSVPPFAAAFEE